MSRYLHSPQHCNQRLGIDPRRNPNRRGPDRDLNQQPSIRAGCTGVDSHGRKYRTAFIPSLMPRRPTPREQLLRRQSVPPRDRRNRFPARVAFRDDPLLLRSAPGAGQRSEYLKAAVLPPRWTWVKAHCQTCVQSKSGTDLAGHPFGLPR